MDGNPFGFVPDGEVFATTEPSVGEGDRLPAVGEGVCFATIEAAAAVATAATVLVPIGLAGLTLVGLAGLAFGGDGAECLANPLVAAASGGFPAAGAGFAAAAVAGLAAVVVAGGFDSGDADLAADAAMSAFFLAAAAVSAFNVGIYLGSGVRPRA